MATRPPQSNEAKARALAQKVARELARGAGKGLQAALPFLTARLKEALSVPAPKARVQDPRTGNFLYVATAPATAGAPPRTVSGRTRAAATYELAPPGPLLPSGFAGGVVMKGRVGLLNLPWGRQLEYGGTIRPRRARALRFFTAQPDIRRRGKKGLWRFRYVARPVFVKSVVQPPHPFLAPTLRKYRAAAAVLVGNEVRLALKP